jgi:hypothetical protein
MCKFLAYIDDFECIFGTRNRKTLIQKVLKWIFTKNWKYCCSKIFGIHFFGPILSDVGCAYKVISRDSYNKVKDELNTVGLEF